MSTEKKEEKWNPWVEPPRDEFEKIGRKYYHCGKRVTKKEFDRLVKEENDRLYAIDFLRGEFE